MDEGLIYEILSVVGEIPEGRVATYGQIARLVGRVLSMSQYYGSYPCHRVVNHAGRLAPGFWEQADRLRKEGVALKDGAHVDLRTYRWNC